MTTRALMMLILWFVIIIMAMTGLFYLTFCTDAAYYVQVDGSRVSGIPPRGGMDYRYELPAFNERGQERLLSFETSRLLREGAYLRLSVAPLRGVTKWEEVQLEDIPDKASQALAVTP